MYVLFTRVYALFYLKNTKNADLFNLKFYPLFFTLQFISILFLELLPGNWQKYSQKNMKNISFNVLFASKQLSGFKTGSVNIKSFIGTPSTAFTQQVLWMFLKQISYQTFIQTI